MRASILIYGRDAQLLETRRWVLEGTGARVWTATKISDFNELAATVSIDLILLCHSLSMEDCGRALAVAHTRWPHVHSIVLNFGQVGCHAADTERTVDAARGPAYLVNTVKLLLGVDGGTGINATQPGA